MSDDYKFTINSGIIRVTDPCYSKNNDYDYTINVLTNCKPGIWIAEPIFVDYNVWGLRCKEIRIYHENHYTINPIITTQNPVGVDSGQLGLFDNQLYPEIIGNYYDQNSFYRKICDDTVANNISLLDFGIAVTSGFGDGLYNCFIGKYKNQIVSIKVVFIEDESD